MPELAHFPARAPIEAYGEGGFRFAGMSHNGSLLITTSGVYAWDVADVSVIEPASLQQVINDKGSVELLILGTGDVRIEPPVAIRDYLAAAGIGLEIMDTGAAARTFNVLLAEERDVAAALIAVGAD